jgi:hypothetical protein
MNPLRLALIALMLSAAARASPCLANDVVIHAGLLLDGIGKAPRQRVSIMVRDARIVAGSYHRPEPTSSIYRTPP